MMVALGLKKLNAPDFSASIREGTPSLMVIDEDNRQPSRDRNRSFGWKRV
jgi:hypothetical protein